MQRQVGGWKTAPTAGRIVERVAEPSFGGLLAAIYEIEAEAHGKERFFVKDNGVITHCAELIAIYPDARFALVVRDPRDVAVSWIKSPAHAGGVRAAAARWAVEQQAALHFFLLAPATRARVHVLYYEDLVADPEPQLKGLCATLGVEFDPAMLSFYETRDAKESAARVDDWKNLASPLLSGNFGKFRRELTARQIQTVEAVAGEQMISYGYPLDFPDAKRLMPDVDVPRMVRAASSLSKLALSGANGRREIKVRMERLSNLRRLQRNSPEVAPLLPGPSVLTPGDAKPGPAAPDKAPR
jgi:hypothetical protein